MHPPLNTGSWAPSIGCNLVSRGPLLEIEDHIQNFISISAIFMQVASGLLRNLGVFFLILCMCVDEGEGCLVGLGHLVSSSLQTHH